MSVGPSSAQDAATRALVLRHVSSLITKSVAFFEQRQDEQLKLLRSHLLQLVDSRPHLTETQNRRAAAMLLDKHGALFNRSFLIALRETLEDQFEAVMPGALAVLRPVDSSGNSSGPASMALLDVDEIEQHLLVDRIAQRFNGRYEATLTSLTRSVGIMLRQEDFSLSDNPFRPATVVRAFLAAWYLSEFEPEVAEDFVTVLDLTNCVDWAPLYASLSETLVRAGFSAKPAHRIKRSSGGDSGMAPLQGKSSFGSTEPASLRSGYASLEPERSRSTMGELASAGGGIAARASQFLHKLGFGRPARGVAADEGGSSGIGWAGAETVGGGAPTQAPAPTVPADPALMGFLGNLLATVRALPVHPWVQGQDLGDQNLLRQMREREEVQRAPELDRGTIDALAEVFDYVFADRAIPTQLKVVIGRLQIPVLKAAMMDRDFFLSSEHPARKLVDALASASVAWTPEKGEADPLYARIENTVKRVLTEFEDDQSLFAQLLTEFNAYLQETEQQVQARIEPAAQQEQSGEALELARSHADDLVHQCISAAPPGESLVPFLLPFLANQWREVMARAWINAEGDPAQWEDVLATMDQVIWSTQPKTSSEDRAKLVAMLPELVRKLNTSLDAIGWAGDERAAFTRLLIDTHMKAIRVARTVAAPLEVGPSEVETKAARDAVTALEQRRASQAAEPGDAFDAQAQGFERGMWFEFTDDQGQRRRYRLSWVSPQRTRMLFTNRDGFEAFVRPEREVAVLLREGRLSVIDQLPIVTRAIEQIMSGAEKSDLDLDLELA